MEKQFEWQYRDEKILLRTHPHMAYFFLEKIHLFLLYSVFIALFIIIAIFLNNELRWILLVWAVIVALLYVWIFLWLYRNTRYTFTSRRSIIFYKKNLFKRGYNEIHLVDLRTAVPKKSGIFGMIFWYGTLIIADKDDKQIVYSGIREHKQIARYLGRIIDYIKINGHTDNLSSYKPKKEREAMKKQS